MNVEPWLDVSQLRYYLQVASYGLLLMMYDWL